MDTKQSVLHLLESHRNMPLSGEEIGKKLGISRSAVWKAIRTLKEDGHIIHSATHNGYLLDASSDILSPASIYAYLPKHMQNIPIHVFTSIDSTNTYTKTLALSGAPHGTLVVANTQTAGRGRRGRSFYSPPDTGIYMSMLLRPNLELKDAAFITTTAAVCAANAIEQVTGASLSIKWVNDLLLDGKKVCGILTESVNDFESGTLESVIIGLGINLKPMQFPEELAEIATSFHLPLLRSKVIGAIAQSLYSTFLAPLSPSWLEEYRRRSWVIGKSITYEQNGSVFFATAVDIDASGGLVVEDEKKHCSVLRSGEITVRRVSP